MYRGGERKTLSKNSMAFRGFDSSTIIRAELLVDISELPKLEKSPHQGKETWDISQLMS